MLQLFVLSATGRLRKRSKRSASLGFVDGTITVGIESHKRGSLIGPRVVGTLFDRLLERLALREDQLASFGRNESLGGGGLRGALE